MDLQEFEQKYQDKKCRDLIEFPCNECARLYTRKKHAIKGILTRKGVWRCTQCGYKFRPVTRRSIPPVEGTLDPIRNNYHKRPPIMLKDPYKKWEHHKLGTLDRTRWSKILHMAALRNIPFDLTMEQAWELFVKQDGKCALSGLPIKHLPLFASRRYKRQTTASLDRIDSKLGYTIENVQWVHKHVNLMKQDLPNDYFVSMCKTIAQHSQGEPILAPNDPAFSGAYP